MEYSTEKAITALVFIFAAVKGGVPLVKTVSDLVEEAAKKRREKKALDVSQAADIKRLEGDERDKAIEEVWKIVNDKKAEIETLKGEIKILKQGNSLAEPTLTRLYKAIRKLGSQLEILDTIFVKEFIRGAKDEDERTKIIEAIKKEMEIVWQRFDELQKSLPQ